MGNFILTIQSYNGFITVILTFFLILFTAYYAWQTYLLAKVTRESSEYERRPIIDIFTEHNEFDRQHFGINNLGSRLAENVHIKAQAIFGLSSEDKFNRLEIGPEHVLLPNFSIEYNVPQLMPRQEAYIGIFDEVI